ncbi:MAG: GDSL-type esterase/lipase family protein [Candidatus Omnitrophica bacterium]|nr:GDSL-type esterase/lipase family protein [Candidatus Omnitrophota bacterium]
MNSFFRKIISLIVGLLILAVAFQSMRINHYTHRTPYTQKPFERILPESSLKILFLGDSTAVGTGAGDPQTSVAGWFGQEFPDAHIMNRSANGRKLRDVLQTFLTLPEDHYQLVVIQVGANDIMRFTSLDVIRHEVSDVLKQAQVISEHVVILHSADVGTAPIFTWPMSWIYSWRSKKVREIYLDMEKNLGILYVDLFAYKTDDIFLSDKGKYYAKDFLHLSADGYRIWYEAIRARLERARAWEGLHAHQNSLVVSN